MIIEPHGLRRRNTMTAHATSLRSPSTAPAPVARRLAGKIALITGGNSGIGLATAEEFLKAGASVVITGRDPSTLQSATSQLRELAAADRLVAVRADVTIAQQLDHAIDEVRERFGRLDVLFVNAGIAEFLPIDEATEQHFDRIFNTNVKGAYFTIQKALPLLAPGASIILNSSIAGMLGTPGTSVYAATKAAVRSFARTLSADLVDRGIRVNVISPGPVTTPIIERLGLSPEARQQFDARVQQNMPLKRFGDPHEIAHAAVFLASDESTFFVGAELVADGGLSQL